MQIHELNDFNGDFSESYVLLDNGIDTGKAKANVLTAETEANIEALSVTLNERIDNIIAGGAAPSKAEIVDARKTVYQGVAASLGDAIRSQVSAVVESSNDQDFVLNEGITKLSNNGLFYQHIKMANYDDGKYYQYNSNTDTVFTIANSGYKVQTIEIPSGTYNFRNIVGLFSFVRNKTTGGVVAFNTLNGGTDAISSGSFTIDYPAVFYITSGHYNTINMLSYGELPSVQTEGWYFIYGESVRRVFRCGSNEKYTTFYSALQAAMQYENSILYVEKGSYDLVAELGSDYFSNFSHANDGWGPVIGNGVEVIFSEGATLNCIYEGTNVDVHTYFSPLNAIREANANNDFVIRGMNINAKNCRYILHDECAVVEVSYRHIIDSCNMNLDNSESLSTLNTRQCIGGGLGYHGYIKITDSLFACEGGWSGVDVVSYHNSSATLAKSKIICRGNYCAGLSTFRFSAYGTQTSNITEVLANNNSLGAAISTRKETPDSGDNVSVYQWNNVVR